MFDILGMYGLLEFHYVIYFLEDEVVYSSGGFNSNEEFEKACDKIVDFCRNQEMRKSA